MKDLFVNVRFYVLASAVLISLAVYVYVVSVNPVGILQTIKLTQIFGFISAGYLYLTLLVTPVTRYFKFVPYRGQIVKARRAVGVSAFYFALLHSSIAFFGQLGGFIGLSFLDFKYLLAVSLGFSALLIFSILAATSFDFLEEKLTHKVWKIIHRFIYLASLLIVVHVLVIGTHFSDLASPIPKIFFSLVAILLILEAKRFDDYLYPKIKKSLPFGVTTVLVFDLVVFGLGKFVFVAGSSVTSFGVHAQHILEAKQSANTKLSVSVSPVTDIKPLVKTNIQFSVFDASSGKELTDFSLNQEKLMHLIIVSDDLSLFDHVHPDYSDGVFTINYSFPKDGYYRLYADFQPSGLAEQVFAFRLKAGNASSVAAEIKKDFSTTSEVNGIKSQLLLPKDLNSTDLNAGKQLITFQFSDATSGADITNIGTYLGAFGHLVMINTDTYSYIHVHPNLSYTPISGEETGPKVAFSPIGIYGTIAPGTYKLFGQFMIGTKLEVFKYFVKVK